MFSAFNNRHHAPRKIWQVMGEEAKLGAVGVQHDGTSPPPSDDGMRPLLASDPCSDLQLRKPNGRLESRRALQQFGRMSSARCILITCTRTAGCGARL